MSVNIQALHETYETIEQHINQFNNKVTQSGSFENDIDKIYPIVQREVDRLTELSEAATQREEELNSRKYCLVSSSLSKALTNLFILKTIAKVCAITGAGYAIFAEEHETIGFGIFVAAEVIDLVAGCYEAKLNLEKDELSRLAKLNKQGVEHAKIFKKFLKALKDINRQESKAVEQNRSNRDQLLSDHIVIHIEPEHDLNTKIQECLKDYQDLPAPYRNENVYCRIISRIIQKLPPNDPLFIGLNQLEPSIDPSEDISRFAETPLPVHYLPTSSLKSRSLSSDNDSPRREWVGEGVPHSNEFTEEKVIDQENTVLEYERQVAHYKNQVMYRFGLKRNISFFETSKGWQIGSKDGVKKIANPIEENDSLELIAAATANGYSNLNEGRGEEWV